MMFERSAAARQGVHCKDIKDAGGGALLAIRAKACLHYNWHRYYDPKTGRYLTPDPIGLEGGLARYVYANGNPVMNMDWTGLVGDWLFETEARRLTQYVNEEPVRSWRARSGSFGSDGKYKKFPLPPGEYGMGTVGSVEKPEDIADEKKRKEQYSYCDGKINCWWLSLDPRFETERYGFGIHPDGNAPGTAGCIGALGADTKDLFEALRGKNGPLTVVP